MRDVEGLIHVVPKVGKLAHGLQFCIFAAFQPALDSLALCLVGLGRVFGKGADVAAFIRHITFAIQAIGLNAVGDEVMQELFALGGFYITLVVKRKLKAEFAELAHAVLLAESLLHGAHSVDYAAPPVNVKSRLFQGKRMKCAFLPVLICFVCR